nr:pentapeptide repeat-containing protein [Cyanobacterium sp. IPPAS B-1200]
MEADLEGADLRGADLRNSTLGGANLKETIMPDGSTHP